jgi:hypothetical protein
MDSTYVKQLMLAKYLFRQGEKALDLRSPRKTQCHTYTFHNLP